MQKLKIGTRQSSTGIEDCFVVPVFVLLRFSQKKKLAHKENVILSLKIFQLAHKNISANLSASGITSGAARLVRMITVKLSSG